MLKNKTPAELIKIIKSKDEIDKKLRAKIKELNKKLKELEKNKNDKN
jgi:hypothetical protein